MFWVYLQAFFYQRSEYFRAIGRDHFDEHATDSKTNSSCANSNLPVVTLHDVSASTFMQVVNFVYSDTCGSSEVRP